RDGLVEATAVQRALLAQPRSPRQFGENLPSPVGCALGEGKRCKATSETAADHPWPCSSVCHLLTHRQRRAPSVLDTRRSVVDIARHTPASGTHSLATDACPLAYRPTYSPRFPHHRDRC